MLSDTFYLYCRFKGSDASRYYTNNKNYLLKVKVDKFGKKVVRIAHIHGYGNNEYPDSLRRYENRAYFEQSWKVIKDVTEETVNGGNGS